MKKYLRVAKRLCAGLGALIVVIVITWAVGILLQENSLQDPAAWVQAIGSLIGIAVAIAVPVSQRQADEEDRREGEFLDRKAAIESVRSLVQHQLDLLAGLQKRGPMTGRSRTLAQQHFELKLQQNDSEVQRLPVDAFGPRYITFLLNIKDAAGLMCLISRSSPMHQTEIWHKMKVKTGSLENLFDRLLEEEEALFKKHGKPWE